MNNLSEALKQHGSPLVLDGAFGTMVQMYDISESDFCDNCHRHASGILMGNNEILNLTRPDVVQDIHMAYVHAGADIITTNTFSANAVSQADYKCTDFVPEMNRSAVRLARKAFSLAGREGYVVGSIGPTIKSLSSLSNGASTGFHDVGFCTLVEAYRQQISVLLSEGVDALFIETIYDIQNARAAIHAAHEVMKHSGCHVPLMLSASVKEGRGELLTGQSLDAFLLSVIHSRAMSVGFNCFTMSDVMLPLLRELQHSLKIMEGYRDRQCFISCHPSAGLPDGSGRYHLAPEQFVRSISTLVAEGLVDVIGGCCGTTPQHIEAVAQLCR